MSETHILSTETINKWEDEYQLDEYFNTMVAPRLHAINHVKTYLGQTHRLDWTVWYSPVNKAENAINISLIDPGKKYHLFYSIPLMQKFELRLHLNDDTFNFLELHHLLLDKGVIGQQEFKVGATKNTLPYLQLNPSIARYDRSLLGVENPDEQLVKNSLVYQTIADAFERFNQPLYNVIFGTWA